MNTQWQATTYLAILGASAAEPVALDMGIPEAANLLNIGLIAQAAGTTANGNVIAVTAIQSGKTYGEVAEMIGGDALNAFITEGLAPTALIFPAYAIEAAQPSAVLAATASVAEAPATTPVVEQPVFSQAEGAKASFEISTEHTYVAPVSGFQKKEGGTRASIYPFADLAAYIIANPEMSGKAAFFVPNKKTKDMSSVVRRFAAQQEEKPNVNGLENNVTFRGVAANENGVDGVRVYAMWVKDAPKRRVVVKKEKAAVVAEQTEAPVQNLYDPTRLAQPMHTPTHEGEPPALTGFATYNTEQ